MLIKQFDNQGHRDNCSQFDRIFFTFSINFLFTFVTVNIVYLQDFHCVSSCCFVDFIKLR